MAEGRRDPQPGDLIEIDRPLYQHWALYVGDGYVTHVTDDGDHSDSCSSTSICTTVTAKKQLLKDVAANHKWRVNNKYDRSYTPRPVEEIIRDAEYWIGKEVTYNVFHSTSQLFVTELRYGKALCDRGRNPGFVAGATALSIVTGVVAVAVTAFLRR